MADNEVGSGAMGSVSAADVYQASFGALAHKSRYFDPLSGIDMRPDLKARLEEGIKRIQAKGYGVSSTWAGGAGTAGVAMIPIYVDPRIVDTTRKYTPFVEAVARVTNIGVTADFNKITAKGAAIAALEFAPLADQNDTFDRASIDIKYLYAKGSVSGQAMAAYPPYMLEGFQSQGSGLAGSAFSPQSAPNAKQLAVLVKARALRELEENLIWNGSASSDAAQFDGIITQQSTTNKTDLNTTDLAYEDVEDAVQAAFDDGGRPNLAGCSSSVLKDLRKIMIDTFHYRPADMTTTLPFGVSSHLVLETMVGPVPVIPSMYISNVSGSKQINFLDMNYIEMRVLQDMTYQELAQTADSQPFMLKIYEALLMKNPAFNSFIGEIK